MKVFFLVKVKTGRIDEVHKQITGYEKISDVIDTFGGWDIVAVGNFDSHDEVTEFMRNQLIEIDGVKESHSLVEAK